MIIIDNCNYPHRKRRGRTTWLKTNQSRCHILFTRARYNLDLAQVPIPCHRQKTIVLWRSSAFPNLFRTRDRLLSMPLLLGHFRRATIPSDRNGIVETKIGTRAYGLRSCSSSKGLDKRLYARPFFWRRARTVKLVVAICLGGPLTWERDLNQVYVKKKPCGDYGLWTWEVMIISHDYIILVYL